MKNEISKVILIKTAPEVIIQGQWYKRPWLGLGALSAFLIDNGFDCEIIDMQFEGLCKSDLINRIKYDNHTLFGITSMTHEIDRAHEIAEEIKANFHDGMVVIGGCHVTALPYETMRDYPQFDYAVYGEGEYTLVELIHSLNKKVSLESIEGLSFRDYNKVVVNNKREWISNLDLLPFPSWRSYSLCDEYPMYSSRGCPYNCKFCMRVLGSSARYRSPEKVIDEMQTIIDNYSPKRITFQDETFTTNMNRVYQLLDLMIERGIHRRVLWDISLRSHIEDRGFYKKLKEAGCYKICMGIESGNDKILKTVNKGISLSKVRRIVEIAHGTGLKVEAYYILGHPNETKESIWETINLATELNTATASFGIMVPYPGTDIYKMALKGEGEYKLLTHKWSSYNKHLGNSLELKNISRAQLEFYQIMAYLSFYIRNHRFYELLKFIWEKRAASLFLLKKLTGSALSI